MKKLSLIALLILSSASFLCARPTGLTSLVIADDPQGVSPDNTVGTGDLFIEDGLEVDGNTLLDGTVTTTSGLINEHETWLTVALSSNVAYLESAISTATLVAGATTFTLSIDYDMVEHCRNATIDVNYATGESTSTFTGSILLTGVNTKGASTTETINVSTNSATGVVAWSKISTMVLTTTSIISGDNSTAIIKIGAGDKLGLANNITAAADLYKIIENSADVQTGGTLNTTYDTYTPATVPNGTNYELYYKAISR
jgi:hypothetical protein